jgi:hypothetical protein
MVSAIGGAVFTVAVCVAMGSLLLRALQLEFYRLEATLFAFVSGAACLSSVVFLLCVIHQARLGVFVAIGSVSIAAATWNARGRKRRASLPAMPRAWAALFVVVFAAFFTLYFTNAVAPEISPDGSSYHLGNVARLWRHNGFDWDFHSIYSSLSQGMEMLFLVAFAIGRHPAAAMVHFAFQTALPLFLVCYGRRFGLPRAGAFAAILVYVSPVVGITGISAYNDVAVATLVFAGFYLLQVNHENLNGKIIFLIGLLSGFSYALKYTAGLTLPVAAGFTRGRRVVLLVAGAAVVAGPWILRTWIWLGNPFAPFLNSWFPNPYWTAPAEHEYLAGLSRYPHFQSYWDLSLQLTVLGGLVPGMIGPVFLLVPLALLALRHPHGRKLLLAGTIYAIPACLNTEVRFLIPALPFFALAMGLAMEKSWGMLFIVTLFQAVLCWPLVMDVYCDPNAWRVRGFVIRPDANFLASHVGDYALKSDIENAVPANARIFSFAGRAAAYIDRDIVVGYESTQGLRIQNALNSGQPDATQIAKSEGCRFLLVNDSDGVNNYLREWPLTTLAKANGTTLYRID